MTVAAGAETVNVRVEQSLAALAPAAWDACANPAAGNPHESQNPHESHNPFVSHAFLSALEDSGSVGPRTGWTPVHLLVEAGGALDAAVPCYVKTHSRGEYVFDAGWADAFERAGGSYYPKLQVSVPFTPVTGPRLLVRDGAPSRSRDVLLAGLRSLRTQLDASSTHLTFISPEDSADLAERGFLTRTDQQFHWIDDGFGDFEGFLGALASRKRKAIRRERRDALAPAGIGVEWVTGSDITEAHWDAFYAFYTDTGSRKWGRPYLNRRFFSLVGERMADRILLVIARRGGRPIAGAINFIGDRALYGRNWGCLENHPFLHFEICYYQAIDFALSRGLQRVEAGAQGEHKLARGYRPVTTYSAHDIADPGLKRAVADYLRRERAYVDAAHEQYEEFLPFRQAGEEQE